MSLQTDNSNGNNRIQYGHYILRTFLDWPVIVGEEKRFAMHDVMSSKVRACRGPKIFRVNNVIMFYLHLKCDPGRLRCRY